MCLHGSRYLAVDVEFPGFLREVPREVSRDLRYRALCDNVDNLKPIQLGAAVSSDDGSLLGAWSFNFHFNPFYDLHSPVSLNFLYQSGVDFVRHSGEGISHELFGRRLGASVLVRNPNVCWVVFSGFYDWGYLMKMLLGIRLPAILGDFDMALHQMFPRRFDIRLAECEGSLTQLASKYGLWHRGNAHTGGSDALLTLELLVHAVTPFARSASQAEAKIDGNDKGLDREIEKDKETDSTIPSESQTDVSTNVDGTSSAMSTESEAEQTPADKVSLKDALLGMKVIRCEEFEAQSAQSALKGDQSDVAKDSADQKCALPACLLMACEQSQSQSSGAAGSDRRAGGKWNKHGKAYDSDFYGHYGYEDYSSQSWHSRYDRRNGRDWSQREERSLLEDNSWNGHREFGSRDHGWHGYDYQDYAERWPKHQHSWHRYDRYHHDYEAEDEEWSVPSWQKRAIPEKTTDATEGGNQFHRSWKEKGNEEAQDHDRDQDSDKEQDKAQEIKHDAEIGATRDQDEHHSDYDFGAQEAAPKEAKEGGRRMNREQQLQQTMISFVASQGGIVDGPRLATEVAARYNQWVRANSGRNDGSFRKWVANSPGLSVEHCGHNKWRVHGGG